MTVDIGVREGGEGLIVHDDHVGRGSLGQDAQRLLEIAGGDLGVVLEEHAGSLAPANIGLGGVMALHGEEDLQALQHVMGVGVGAQADEDALLIHLEHRGAAHCITHVGLGVVADHSAGLLDDIHLGGETWMQWPSMVFLPRMPL